MSNEILHSRIEKRFQDIFESPPEISDYIYKNLSHELRPYQLEALRHFIYTQESTSAQVSFRHLLFHMATGSGKTMVLAATMLYLFKEKGQQNFIFFVNSDAIIKKTADNLTNMASPKYLFTPEGIVIDGSLIKIQLVEVFPALPAENTIYLKLTTIQKLHMDLTNPRENSLTYESLKTLEIVLLADEAHHINALTRSDKRKLSNSELEEKTWEKTISILLSLHSANRLIEFTATIDLTNDALFEKYRDKIVFQYDLRRFMEDGYSKNVILLRANEDDTSKILNSTLLSQYRKYIASENGIDLKPIILFKSNKIATSLQANRTFIDIIQNLTPIHLENLINHGVEIYQNEQSIWNKMFIYYQTQNLSKVVQDLQWEFTSENILNANDSSFLSEGNALLLNTLEDLNNPIRAIFAVAKLNEGWDVLNLFDIVRISEGATGTRTTTDSEAQLIGRGARYFPFIHEEQGSYVRRFDFSSNNLKIIETLHYHTINENSYIRNLEKSLEAANIQVKEDEYDRLQAKVKSAIRKKNFFKHGKIYINRLVPTTSEDYQSFQDYNVSQTYDVSYESGIEQQFLSGQTVTAGTNRHEEQLVISKPILQKAIQRNTFYRFNNLKKYIPGITSIKQFIESDNFLGNLTVNLSLPQERTIVNLQPQEILSIAERFLSHAEKKIRSNYMKERGTPIFEGVSFSELIDDYVVEMNKVNQRISTVNQVIRKRNMRDHDWYIYDQAIVNGLESDMIDFVSDYVEKLRQVYKEVYLIRNERKVKIVEIGSTRGFMPDFLLYLEDEDFTYQVFLEPKGGKFREQDKWKEDFLVSLSTRTDIEILDENDDVRLIGIKFYASESDIKQEFREDFTEKLLPGVIE